MRNLFIILILGLLFENGRSSPIERIIFKEVLFYDSYGKTVLDELPTGVIRMDNTRVVTQLNPMGQLFQCDTLLLNVQIHARCDNYDRIGSVNLLLLDRSQTFKAENIAHRLELGRFITPFMNHNYDPKMVPYTFDISHIGRLIQNSNLLKHYDFWIQLRISGIPYAAQKEVIDCTDRNDTFAGSLSLVGKSPSSQKNTLQDFASVAFYEDLNNYKATEVPEKTVKTLSIRLEKPLKNAKLYWTSSNHGAGWGGEEYNRRKHFLYWNDRLVDVFTPGGKSCEPYRKYNTQSNGIYSPFPKPESSWISSNWCPGAAIPSRVYSLGKLRKETHRLTIEVPDAVFQDKKGNIPFSAHIQGEL